MKPELNIMANLPENLYEEDNMPVKIDPDPTLHNNLMAFGWECDNGWYPLIQELIDKLVAIEEEDFELLQIKEKFGTLRFYISGASDKVLDIIDDYELFSSHICEICGAFWTAKNRVNHGWWKTLCDKCAKELNYLEEK